MALRVLIWLLLAVMAVQAGKGESMDSYVHLLLYSIIMAPVMTLRFSHRGTVRCSIGTVQVTMPERLLPPCNCMHTADDVRGLYEHVAVGY